MPNRDGTGPIKVGSIIGRGLGKCIGINTIKPNIGHRRGFRNGNGIGRHRGRGFKGT